VEALLQTLGALEETEDSYHDDSLIQYMLFFKGVRDMRAGGAAAGCAWVFGGTAADAHGIGGNTATTTIFF
jgi:hypothetical protein